MFQLSSDNKFWIRLCLHASSTNSRGYSLQTYFNRAPIETGHHEEGPSAYIFSPNGWAIDSLISFLCIYRLKKILDNVEKSHMILQVCFLSYRETSPQLI